MIMGFRWATHSMEGSHSITQLGARSLSSQRATYTSLNGKKSMINPIKFWTGRFLKNMTSTTFMASVISLHLMGALKTATMTVLGHLSLWPNRGLRLSMDMRKCLSYLLLIIWLAITWTTDATAVLLILPEFSQSKLGSLTKKCAPFRGSDFNLKSKRDCSSYKDCKMVARATKSYFVDGSNVKAIQKEIMFNGPVLGTTYN